MNPDRRQQWDRGSSETFRRSRDRDGDLSNMTFGFILQVNGITFQRPEGLYQALRSPQDPALQRRTGAQRSGMEAKRTAYAAANPIHPDWDKLRVRAMALTLAEKLAQHPKRFATALLFTEDHAIVEESGRDDFWGARPGPLPYLTGANVLGQLLTQLRGELKKADGDPQQAAAAMRKRHAEPPLTINSNPLKD